MEVMYEGILIMVVIFLGEHLIETIRMRKMEALASYTMSMCEIFLLVA